jgi:monothiol glutaredoxin
MPLNADAVHVAIKRTIDEHEVALFMKGEPSAPECEFSATVVKILDYLGIDFVGVDVLKDPAIRAGIKGFSDWPTVPQLYVRGEFVGGADIVREMLQSGELKSLLSVCSWMPDSFASGASQLPQLEKKSS